MTYQELKQQNAPLVEVFFAFSDEQLQKGQAEAGIPEGSKIYSGGAGLYGTADGLRNFRRFYDERKERIASLCSPQSIYEDEFINHECGYLCDDTEAIDVVVYYFGVDVAETVNRRHAYSEL